MVARGPRGPSGNARVWGCFAPLCTILQYLLLAHTLGAATLVVSHPALGTRAGGLHLYSGFLFHSCCRRTSPPPPPPPPGTTPAGTSTLPPTMPTAPGSTAGLHLLASVASSASTGTRPPPGLSPAQERATPTPALLAQGPYNPAAVLPTKVAKKILDLEFVEMAEISLDDPLVQTPGHPPLPARLPIQDISIWVEKYSVMAALIASHFPDKAPELFAYQASIVRAERNFDDRCWVAYDRCYRREALAQRNLNWSVPNASLYNEAFRGRARVVPRCTFCLQEDHVAQYCLRSPSRSWLGWLQGSKFAQPPLPQRSPLARGPQSPEFCCRYNEGTKVQNPRRLCHVHCI